MATKVKICGITSLDDAMWAAREGADFLGYIFYPPSKRFVAPRNAQYIVENVRDKYPDVQHVGVFVDDDVANIAWIANLSRLDLVQLHGRETPTFCAELDLLGVHSIKTIGIGPEGTTIEPDSYHTPYFLCDTHDENLKGGTGRRFDLDRLPASISHDKLFLAGGLNCENVSELLSAIRPFAVDISTGVEASPGVKSHRLIKRFLAEVRRINDSSEHPPDSQETKSSPASK
jgi:phosphoribosylanthranilate isomerase